MSESQGISVKAVVVGVVVDIVASVASGVVIGIFLIAQGTPPHAVEKRMLEPTGLLVCLVLSIGCTVVGGYIAGLMAKRSEVFHGALVGVLGILLFLPFMSSYPLWYNAAAMAAGVPCAMFGGWLAASPRKNEYDRERLRAYEERDAGW